VGTWRVAELPVGQATPPVCGRECIITLDRQALVVKTREDTNTYLPGKPIRTSIEPSASNKLRVETTTTAVWDNSTLVITMTAKNTNPYNGQVSERKFINRLTMEGDRLTISTSPPLGRSGAARSEFIYQRVK
jgi:hypothetical protein